MKLKNDNYNESNSLKENTANKTTGQLVNEAIRSPQVQLIQADGANIGVVSRAEALTQAKEAGLDLVMLSESGAHGVPVVKIMDHGKELYRSKKKHAEAKKNQKIILVKEVKIRPKIGEHDYQTKMNQGIGFLEEGKKLKITLLFKGREVSNKEERGNELFAKIDHTFEERGMLERLNEEKDLRIGSAWSKIFSLKKV